MQVDGYSLDAQRDKLRKYAAYEDMVIAGEYSDEGFSGKNIQGRQDFQRMLNDIQDCKDGVSYVLVFKLSRFGRNAADVLNSLQLMQDFGVNLICVEDGIDSSKDAGKLMISVLSAVAEIERENIRTQTMAGREQKAREGKWNGGFAPYGYSLENGDLVIAEDEVEVIRVIYDRYIHTNEGVAGVAKYLNRNGFVKKLRQNNTIPGFSRSFVQDVLDNPVYMGKIAYGRRRTEKKQGTRNEMHVVEQSEFPIYDGQHEAIVSEEDWYLAQEKRKINSFKREKVNNPDHAHILSGILKCPCCGKSMYGNIAKAHSKDKKTRYYYYCKNTVTPTGHECSFRLNIEQTEINKFVAKIISAMVNNPRFVEAIQAKIGSAVDTEDMEKQIAVLQGQLKQAFGTKSRLERQMDTLDINDAHYDRKILDLQRRYDEQYDTIEDIEVQIGELQSQIRSIQQEKISGDNIYRLLLAFDEVYHSATEAEQKEFMKAFIERIEMFPEKRKDGSWIKKIVFNFPVPVDGEEVKELPLETETTVDLVILGPLRSLRIASQVIVAKVFGRKRVAAVDDRKIFPSCDIFELLLGGLENADIIRLGNCDGMLRLVGVSAQLARRRAHLEIARLDPSHPKLLRAAVVAGKIWTYGRSSHAGSRKIEDKIIGRARGVRRADFDLKIVGFESQVGSGSPNNFVRPSFEEHAVGAVFFQCSAVAELEDRFAVVECAVEVDSKDRHDALGVGSESVVDHDASLKRPGLLSVDGGDRNVREGAQGCDRKNEQHKRAFFASDQKAAQNGEQREASGLGQDLDAAGQNDRLFRGRDGFLKFINVALGKIIIRWIFIVP